MTKSPQKNVPDVGIELGAACMSSYKKGVNSNVILNSNNVLLLSGALFDKLYIH